MSSAAPIVDPNSFVRADGRAKVDGTGRYAADLAVRGMAHAAFRYAGVSRGVITSIDTSAAMAVPGVMTIMTADDVPEVRYSPGVADRTLFARDVVRFEGEVVAAVVASTPEAARIAADLIDVRIDQQEPILDLEAALQPTSALVHEEWSSYEADTERDGNVASYSAISRGDAVAAMADAATVVTSRYVADGCHAVPIEPRAILAQWDGDKVMVWSSTQVPFDARAGVCQTLGLPTNKVRVVVPHLGGGFGGKCGFHFEAHVAAMAREVGRPVKLTFRRWEEFLAPDRRREDVIAEVTTGLDDDGRIVARTGSLLLDNGAYIADGAFFPQLAAMHLAGPYRVPALHVEARLVYTNKQPSGSVRAPTAPQCCWALESHTDELADAIGVDPVEFRRLNSLSDGDVGAAGQQHGEIGLRRCIDAALEEAESEGPLEADEGLGIAIGWWPSFSMPSGAYVKIDDDGRGQIITGAQECGTGAVMTLRYLAADELGMDAEDFELIYQDTSVAPYDMGATGSQTLVNNGRAVVAAAAEVAQQLKELAAAALEAAAEDIVLARGRAHVAGSPAVSVGIEELAATASGGELLSGKGSGLPAAPPELVGATCVGDQGMAAWFAPQFSCHVARVHVDPDTGVTTVRSIAAAHDSGTIINPIGATGQVEGAVMMGIGQALSEGTVYDATGRQQNPGLLDYKLQTAADAPRVSVSFVELAADPGGPHGAKGLAEAPNVPTAAAVANAIARATGARLRRLPMTPERVWDAMHDVRPA